MPLGRLIRHLADLPGMGRRILGQDEFVLDPATVKRPVAASHAEALEIFDRNVEDLLALLDRQGDGEMMARWSLKRGDLVVFELPRIAAVRAMIISHSIHHRGQLSSYIRPMGGKVPSIYGPSGDDPGQ